MKLKDKLEPMLEALKETIDNHKLEDEVLIKAKHLKLMKDLIEEQILLAVILDSKIRAKNKRINYLHCKVDNLTSEAIKNKYLKHDRFEIKG